jgi:hypothetical protein
MVQKIIYSASINMHVVVRLQPTKLRNAANFFFLDVFGRFPARTLDH